MLTAETLSHVHRDENGVAWIDDTRVKVVELVMSKRASGYTPEEMHNHYPHLSLAQIYAALAYYHDHRAELDAQIDRQTAYAEQMRQEAQNAPHQKRLRDSRLGQP